MLTSKLGIIIQPIRIEYILARKKNARARKMAQKKRQKEEEKDRHLEWLPCTLSSFIKLLQTFL